MRKAIIKNGKIERYYDDVPEVDITEHRHANVIEADKPSFNEKTQRLNRKVVIGTDVNISWEVENISSADIESTRISGIKGKASIIILDLVDVIKQRNIIARTVELNDKVSLTEAEETEHKQYEVIWSYIKSVRSYSNDLESDVNKPYAEDGTWPTLG